VEFAAQFDPTRENSLGPYILKNDRSKIFHDKINGGAWPFLVRGVIRLPNRDNERDLNLLTRLLFNIFLKNIICFYF